VFQRVIFAKDQPFPSEKGAETHIIHGEAAKRGQFPYQAAIYMDRKSFCGGSLIGITWILTAAHCAVKVKAFTVYLGALEIKLPDEPGRIVQESTVAYPHEEYNAQSLNNDVALVELPEAIRPNGKCFL